MRKLASVQRAHTVAPIDGADFIEKAGILGWYCVVKKGEFNLGDMGVYFEIDSLLPERKEFEFLRKSSWNKTLGKYRLKTAKLRGIISQGLFLPLKVFPELMEMELQEGDDLTEVLGVEKYEQPIPAVISGEVRSFSWPVAKTDEERVQSNLQYLEEIKGKPFVVTCKLDGTSASYLLLKDGKGDFDFHVCGRNYSYREDEINSFWQVANRYRIKENLINYYDKNGVLLALQGELCGPSIQSNPLGLKEADVFVFNVVDTEKNERFSWDDMVAICEELGLKTVPLIERGDAFSWDLETVIAKGEGKYRLHFPQSKPAQEREGIVIRSLDQKISFKSVSNRYLLKGGE